MQISCVKGSGGTGYLQRFLHGARYVAKARPKTSALPGRRPVLRASVGKTPVRPATARLPARAPVRPPVAKTEPKPTLDKDVEASPAASPASGGAGGAPVEGHYELDPLTARVLEEELQQIMIKVWQDLPEVGRSDVERVVVDKLRNEAGEQLRNVLGLNVTKRLLNTFNPLSVKVHFTTKPERKYLRLFLKKYNFVAFKRVARVVNTFAAQVRTIADYDQLCRHRDVYCGAAKITITPYYRFKQCPKNLKTIYSTHEEDKNTESNEAIEKAMEEEVEANITNLKDNPPSDSMSEEDHTTTVTKSGDTESKDEETKTKENDKSKNETVNKPESTKSVETTSNAANLKPTAQSKPQVKNNTTPMKPQVKAAPNSQAQNKSVQKTTPVKPQPEVETTKPNVEKKAEIAKPQAKIENSKAQQVETPKVAAKADAPDKAEPIKAPAKVDPPKVQAKIQPAKPQTKVEPAKPTPTKPKVATPNVNKPKNVVKTPIKNVSASNNTNIKVGNKPVKSSANDKKNNKRSFDEYDDYEELDDEDILALMSRGIVLDECSGSDDNS